MKRSPMRHSAGTVIPLAVRRLVEERDQECVIARFWPHVCGGRPELDHVLNGGLGRKGPSTPGNLIRCCSVGHQWKTENSRIARPKLLAYLASVGEPQR
jgi:hypothetical protein